MENEIIQSNREAGRPTTDLVDVENAQRIAQLKSGQEQIQKDGDIVESADNEAKSDPQATPAPQANDSDRAPLDEFLSWVTSYGDSPLDFAPLPSDVMAWVESPSYDRLALLKNSNENDGAPDHPKENDNEHPARLTILSPTEIAILPPLIVDAVAEANSEEGLPEGNVDEDGATLENDESNLKVVTGTITVSDPKNLPLTLSFGQPSDPQGSESLSPVGFYSGGQLVEWTGAGSNSLTGTIDPTGLNIPVITITINNLGNYTITVLRPLDHPVNTSNGSNDEDALIFSVPVIVSNGIRTATGTLTFQVEDDSPELQGPVLVQTVNEDGLSGNPGGIGDAPGTATTASASLKILWGADNLNDDSLNGANGDRTVKFTTSVVQVTTDGSTPAPLTAGGLAVSTALLSNGALVGYTGAVAPTSIGDANVVFHASLSDLGAGSYNFTLVKPLDHPVANTEDDLQLKFNFTAKDSDGDVVHGSFAIIVNDDSPAISVNANAEPVLVVDETNLAIDASASFAGNFTSAFGADGAGTLVYTLGTAGGASGLVDTASNEAVNLVLNGSVIEGRTAGGNLLVFTVSVNAAGTVTLDQIRAVVHPNALNPDDSKTLSADNLITLTGTITDKDGDSDSAVLNIGQNLTFKDDGPTASHVIASVILDEDGLTPFGLAGGPGDVAGAAITTTGLLGYTAGADGLKSIALSGPSTLGTESVTSTWNSGTNTLTISAVRNAVSVNLMTVQVTNQTTGAYLVTLLAPLMHPIAGTEDNITLNVGYVVTDGDNDTAAGSLQVTINDDSPTAIAPDSTTLINMAGASTSSLANLPRLDIDGNIDNNIGADQKGTLQFANIINGQQATGIISGNATNLTSGGQNIKLFLVDHDSNSATPNQLQGWTGGLNTGTKIFTVNLNHDSTDATPDTYQVDIHQQIGATIQNVLNTFTFGGAGAKAFNYIDVPGTTEDLLFSGFHRSASNVVTIGTVNTNNTSIGVNNQAMNDGENLRVDFVSSPTITNSSSNSYNYGAHYNANAFSFAIMQLGGGTNNGDPEIWIRIYNADDDDPAGTDTATHFNALANDPQLNTITEITVNGAALNLGTLTTDGNGGYLIRGLSLNDVIKVTASGAGYNRIEIANAISGTHGVTDPTLNGDVFDIGKFGFVKTVTNIPSVGIKFDLALTDADGDSITVANAINITLTSPTPPVVLDLNGDGLHFLSLSDPQNQALFDWNGDGVMERSAWISPHDGFLAFDANGDQKVNNGSELVFARYHPDAKTDLDGLRLFFDTNKDGVLDSLDEQFSKFGVWQDANSNGVSDPGEFLSLTHLGITGINLTGQGLGYFTANGNAYVNSHASFTYQDGSLGLVGDVTLGTIQASPSVDASHMLTSEPVGASITGAAPSINDLITRGSQTVDHLLPTTSEGSAVIAANGDSGGSGDLAASPMPVSHEAPALAAADTSSGSVDHVSHDAIEALDDAPAAI